MLGFGHHGCSGSHSGRTAIALILLAKLSLIVGALVSFQLGAGYIGTGISMVALHGVVLAALMAFALRGAFRAKLLFANSRHREADHSKGILLHDPARYDLLARVLTFGREGRFRQLMLRPAALRSGEAVLDVACGTGTLAIAAKRQVGPMGSLTGVDASARMIEHARLKAERAGLEIEFVQGTAQELPFHDRSFDVVMGTLMLHHLSKSARAAFACEARRVLKTGGRLLLVDFGKPTKKTRLLRLHRHGHVDMEAIGSLLSQNGFGITEIGDIRTKNLRYILAVPS